MGGCDHLASAIFLVFFLSAAPCDKADGPERLLRGCAHNPTGSLQLWVNIHLDFLSNVLVAADDGCRSYARPSISLFSSPGMPQFASECLECRSLARPCSNVMVADCILLFLSPGMPQLSLGWNYCLRLDSKYVSTLRKIKYCRRPCLYYYNTTASFNFQLIGDIVFKLNPGPNVPGRNNRVKSTDTIKRSSSSRHRNHSNLIQVDRDAMPRWNNNITQLTMCCVNARSLKNKSAAFNDLVCDLKPDLFTLSETWLSRNDCAVLREITPEGYKFCHCPRSDRRGGGTAILFKDNFEVKQILAAEKPSFEVSEWLVTMGSVRLRTVIVYRPPYSSAHPVTTSSFIAEFAEYLEATVLSSEPLLICGGFNIHVDVSDDGDSIRFLDILESMGLQQHVQVPTHELGHTLDLIITRHSDDLLATSPSASRFFSDHAVVHCLLKPLRPQVSVKRIQFRKLKTIDAERFTDDIRNSTLCHNPPDDLNALVSCYNKTLEAVLDKHAPLQTRNIIVRPRAPWFNEEIRQAKRERRKAERKWRTTKLQCNLLRFKMKRNRVIFLMNEARREHYTQFIENNRTDQRKLFRASKDLLNLQADKALPHYTDAYSLANQMGEFFVQKIDTIRSKIGDIGRSSSSPPIPADVPCSGDIVLSDFNCLTEEAVRKLITSSKMKSCALDPIPSSLLPVCLEVLLPVITRIVNLSLQSGDFAHEWKTALVNPLLKKSGLDPIFKNFRPVSNLQFVSKVAERMVANQTQDHMVNNKLFPSLQSAYRKHYSTETALLKVKNDLLMNMNSGHVTLLVLLDLSAAFDTVDHQVLLRRLSTSFGVCGKALSWFTSYLHDRSQRVSINGTLSRAIDLKCGIPQGSCLGPLLFSIYASKLFDIVKEHLPDVHTYADDTQLYLSFSPKSETSQAEAVVAIENCIRAIRSWMTEDMLLLNDEKTEVLLIGTRQQLAKVSVEGIKVGDTDVSTVPTARNLGAWFDSHLDMNTHITKTCSSAFFYLYNIRHIRKYLTKESTETLIHAFITSRLDYCNSLLYGLPDYQLHKLQRALNASARIVFRTSKFCHITPLFRELHWLPVRLRIEFKILLIIFKVVHGMAPDYLSNLISIMQPSAYNLRRNNNGPLLSTPSCKSKKTLGDRAFMFAAPKLWNALPVEIRQLDSITVFKTKVKTLLFSRAF